MARIDIIRGTQTLAVDSLQFVRKDDVYRIERKGEPWRRALGDAEWSGRSNAAGRPTYVVAGVRVPEPEVVR